MSRLVERTLEGVQQSPDGTVLAFRLHESYDAGPPRAVAIGPVGWPAAHERRRRRARVLGGLAVLGTAIVVGVPVLAQVVP